MRKKQSKAQKGDQTEPAKADGPTQRRRSQTPSGHDRKPSSVPIVGIGASAGGLEAFTKLLEKIALNSGLAFVLVQHLDPERESALAQILTRSTRLPVCEATNRMRVEADHVYIIPPNTLLTLEEDRLKLEPRRMDDRPQRTIDVFFESLAHERREQAIGVILSGTASDGTMGLEAIKAEGGLTIAQDESAKYDSMPRNAIASGCVDFVLSPEEIAKELARIAKHLSEVERHGSDQQDASGTTQEEGGGGHHLTSRGPGQVAPETDGNASGSRGWTSRPNQREGEGH
ncbi:MAG: chemotaxis protein CheB [Nitrospira sp.]